MPIISKVSRLFLVVILVSANAVHAQHAELEGCWKTEHLKTYYSNGDTRESKPDCFELFGDRTIETACVNSLGVVTGNTKMYSGSEPNIFETVISKAGRTIYGYKDKEVVEYRMEGNKLIRTVKYDVSDMPARIISLVKAEHSAVRLPSNSTKSCLPVPITVTKEDFYRYFSIQDLILETIGLSLQLEVSSRFRVALGEKIPGGALSESEQKRVLIELDRISVQAKKALRAKLLSDAGHLEKVFFSRGRCGSYINQDLASVEKQRWAGDAVKEVIGSGRFVGYLYALRPLMSEKRKSELLQTAEKIPPMKNYQGYENTGLGSTFEVQRGMLFALAGSPWLIDLIPNGSELAQLRDLSIKNIKTAATKNFVSETCLEDNVNAAAEFLISNELKEFFAGDAMVSMQKEVNLLAQRVKVLVQASPNPAVNTDAAR